MAEKIKSGNEVIEDFFAEILNIEDADEKTVQILVSLEGEGKLTDKNIQNALDALLQKELALIEKQDE